jgi:hypothetical protein
MAEHDARSRRGQTVCVAVTDDSLTAGRLWQMLADSGIRSIIRTHDILPGPGGTRTVHYRYEVFVLEQDVARAIPLLGDEVRVPGLAAEPPPPALAEPVAATPERSVRPGARAAALVLPVLLVVCIVGISMMGGQGDDPNTTSMVVSASPATHSAALAPPTQHPPETGTVQAATPTPEAEPEGSASQIPRASRAVTGTPVQPVDSTFVVNTAPVGCHQEPNAGADMVLQFPPGAVQSMNAIATQPDGVWQRQADRGCWTRISGAPVSVFSSAGTAECFAVAFRRPPPLVAHCVAITTVNGAPAGGVASLLAQAPPGSVCTGNSLSVKAGSFRVQEFGSRPADANGWVYWSWEVHPDTPPGPSAVTITCLPGGSATATLPVG